MHFIEILNNFNIPFLADSSSDIQLPEFDNLKKIIMAAFGVFASFLAFGAFVLGCIVLIPKGVAYFRADSEKRAELHDSLKSWAIGLGVVFGATVILGPLLTVFGFS